MNLLDRILDVLAKINFDEAIQLRREIESAIALNPSIRPILLLKLMALKNAHKNSAEAVKALEHLGLAEKALAFHAALNKEIQDLQREINEE